MMIQAAVLEQFGAPLNVTELDLAERGVEPEPSLSCASSRDRLLWPPT